MSAEEQRSAHRMEIVSLGECPAAKCSCNKWATALTREATDTTDKIKSKLRAAYREHIEEIAE